MSSAQSKDKGGNKTNRISSRYKIPTIPISGLKRPKNHSSNFIPNRKEGLILLANKSTNGQSVFIDAEIASFDTFPNLIVLVVFLGIITGIMTMPINVRTIASTSIAQNLVGDVNLNPVDVEACF